MTEISAQKYISNDASEAASTASSSSEDAPLKVAMAPAPKVDLDWVTWCVVFLWYSQSVVCTNLSKLLKEEGVTAPQLGLAQLVIAVVCSYIVYYFVNHACPLSLAKIAGAADAHQHRLDLKLWKLATIFACGFMALNSSFSYIDVSLAVTLRAAEPLFAAGADLIAGRAPTLLTVIALVVICAGAGIAASASAPQGGSATYIGIGLVALANVIFVARSIVAKDISASFPVITSQAMYHHVCMRGVAVQSLLLLFQAVAAAAAVEGAGIAALSIPMFSKRIARMLFVNGLCFYGYMSCSFFLLGKIPMLTHTVFNAMRRPVNVLAAVLLLGDAWSSTKGFGIALACAGAAAYAIIGKLQNKS